LRNSLAARQGEDGQGTGVRVREYLKRRHNWVRKAEMRGVDQAAKAKGNGHARTGLGI
jgi:hypothetical protein